MSRRIDVELTSSRDDGTWTWRAAGAKQPKGVLNASLLYEGAAVGDRCKIEAEFLLDGVDVIEVFAPKKKKERTDLLEMVSRPLRDDELVTQTKAPRTGRSGGRDGGRDGGRRGPRGDGGRDGGRRDGGNRDGGRGRGPRREAEPAKPKPKRLRARRAHRDEVLASIPEEHRPIADQVLQGGIPAVRSAIEKQNAEAKANGTPEVPVETVLAIAEPLVPKLRTAEWHDKADAALADLAELDLRDLRSVVVASDAAARDETTRALAEQLKTGLNERIEKDHAEWMSDLETAVKDGRTVRALRLSSRPVKAGSPLPPELAKTMAEAASAALAADVAQDRWATVLDAVAFSPIRSAVVPSGFPAEPKEEMLEAVRRVADRVPTIAAHYGIDPSEAAKAKRRRPPRRKPDNKGKREGGRDRNEGGRGDAGGRNDGGRNDGGRDGRRDGGRGNDRGRGRGRDERRDNKPKVRDLPPVPGAEPKVVVEETPAEDVVSEEVVEAVAEEAVTETPATEEAASEAPEAAEATEGSDTDG